MTYSTVELIKAQMEIQHQRAACWDGMRQARIDNDPNAYTAAKYRKEGLTQAIHVLDRFIDAGMPKAYA